MTNAYFTSPNDIAPITRARSVDINAFDQAVDAAFDKLPAEDLLKRGTINYAVTTAAVANAYAIELAYAPTAYSDGMGVTVKFHATNTGTTGATLDVNALGPKPIQRFDGTLVAASDLQGVMELRYNATTGAFHVGPNALALANQAQASATAAATSAGASAASASASASSATNSADSASASSASAVLSSEWAQKTSGPVDGAGYSAKYWAGQAETAVASANLPLIDAATDAFKVIQVKPDGSGYQLTAMRGRLFFASAI